MLGEFEVILTLLTLVAVLALVNRKLGLPLPIFLVVAGLLISLVPGLPPIRLRPDVVFILLLPPLLYPAALSTPWRDFKANLRPILLLAIGFVLFTTLVVAFVAHRFLAEFTLGAGFVLGAIVSPPDAVAAMAVAERLRVPHRIITVLEGESLVNDATALVAYRFAVAAVVTGAVAWKQITVQFFVLALGGILFGLIVGFVMTWVQKRIDDPPIEITLSLLTPFAAYLPAERLGISGILAVVTTGLYQGWHLPEMSSSNTRLRAGSVWEMIEFVLNGFVFLLIGLQFPAVVGSLQGFSRAQLVWYALIVSAAVILIRIVWVFPATYLPRFFFKSIRAKDPYPAWQHVAIVAWTGMRGVVSLAAALALPLQTDSHSVFPARNLILYLTFSVIIATLVIQGLSLPVMIRWLNLKEDRSMEEEEREARVAANKSALERLDDLLGEPGADTQSAQRLRAEYEERLNELSSQETCRTNRWGLYSENYEQLAREALKVERQTLIHLRNKHVINDEVLRRIQRDIDLAEVRLRPSRGR